VRIRSSVVSLVAVLTAGLAAGPALAGGLYLSSFGTPSMGTASAGANAVAYDASTSFMNPAGMTRLDDHELLFGLAPGFSRNEFRQSGDTPRAPDAGGNGGNQGGFVPITSTQYVHKLSERLRLGMSIFSISGASLDPSDDWAGRNQFIDMSLFTLSFQPTLGVRVTDWLSLGGGAAISYGSLDMTVRAPLPLFGEPEVRIRDADDWAAAGIGSVLIEFTPELRLGVLYQGETDFDFSGNIDLPPALPNGDIDLELDLAQAVRVSGYWEPTEKWALLLSGGWEDWSELDAIPVSFGLGSGDLVLDFRDVWYVAGGFHYREGPWTWQFGLRYDSSPVSDNNRLAFLPSDRIWTVAFGTLHNWSENLRLGFAFQYSDLGRANLQNEAVKGRYEKNDLILFNVSIQLKNLPWAGKLQL
jgi:long-chain fatty acid transport protein